jgi:hypothetical protein
MCGGGGGGGPQQVTSQVTQTSLPAYVQPYFENILQRGLYESARPYEAYPGQRLAQFAPEETFAQQNIMGLQRPEQLGLASDIAARVGYAGMPSGMGIAGQFRPEAVTPTYQATEFQPGYTAGAFAPGFQAQQFQSGYQAGQFQPGYAAGQFGGGFEAGSLTAPGALESYMSPYQQAVTDIERREAIRASQMQAPEMGAAAARAGARGGTREALIEAERQRNLSQQLGDIQARGSQAGFQQAQQAFEADRAARLQQAQFGLGAFQAQEGARQRAAELGLSAQQQQEAARQAQEQFRQSAFGMGAEERQFQANIGLQSQQAGEAARQRAAELGLSAQQQTDAARQAEEQFRTQAQQFNIEQQRQRALLGLEGLAADRAGMAQRLAAAELLGGMGSQQQALDLQRLGAQMGVGTERRGLMQRGLDLGYEDFLRQQAYGREQLGYLSNLLQGVPIQPGSTVSTFGRVPTTEQQLLGSGLGALGLYQTLGRGG